MRKLKTDRSLFKYILFGILTFGIYEIWYLHHLVKDINELCREDGKKSPGIFVALLLTLVTCGLYSIFWWYRLADMLNTAARRRNMEVSINGGAMIACMLLGNFVCGIASWVGIYWVFEACNMLATDYNSYLYTRTEPETAEN